MIPRYEKKVITQIWDEENKFRTYLEVELAVLQALEENQRVPANTVNTIKSKASINVERINQIELETKHDVIAFCSSITEKIEPAIGKYFHFGVTSSDIIDTATTLQIKRSLEQIMPAFEKLLKVLALRAKEFKDLPTMGRSHGIYAEPLSLGQKILGHYNEFHRRYQELKAFYQNELTAQFSGAVGNYTILSPSIEEQAAKLLNLKVEPLSTQVIPRDRIGKLVSLNGLTASAIERLSVEIRHLHRSEVNELHEGFSKGQKGSSIMPHKKNPIAAENLSGMARVLRSHVLIALENIVLWHERDISHSSTERLYLPDHLGLMLYSLERLASTVENLEFHVDEVERKVKDNFVYLSSFYLHHLIENTDFTREQLYKLVQEASFHGHQQNSAHAFHGKLAESLNEKGIKLTLPQPDFKAIKSIYLKNVDELFERCFSLYPVPL